MTDAEFDALVDKIYHELRIEYGLEQPEQKKETVYPLPLSPLELQQAAMINQQINQQATMINQRCNMINYLTQWTTRN